MTVYIFVIVAGVIVTISVAAKSGDETLLTVVFLQAIVSAAIVVELFRHQRALEWFQSHVRLENNRLPNDAPKDMGRKDGKDK